MSRNGNFPIRVLGGGPAALASTLVLGNHGIEVSLIRRPVAYGPTVLLNDVTIRLLQELFGCEAALWSQGQIIRGRLVSWSNAADDAELVKESGLAIRASSLHRLLEEALRSGVSGDRLHILEPEETMARDDSNWTVEARGRSTNHRGRVLNVGERVALTCEARIDRTADPSLCAVESLENGWLFLLPLGQQRVALQAVIPKRPHDCEQTFDELLSQSRLIARHIRAVTGNPKMQVCAPRFTWQPACSGWLATGDAALSFDPICGDGSGQAIRCGLLAAAVIHAIQHGEPEEACLAHYRRRLARAFWVHLKGTTSFYAMARTNGPWRPEIDAAVRAIECLERDERYSPLTWLPRYRLQDLSLTRTLPLAVDMEAAPNRDFTVGPNA